MEILVEGFAWALAEFPMAKIVKAMREYVMNHNDIPAPADIRNIISKDKPFSPPDLGKLLEYRERGIPLMPDQLAKIQRAENI